MLRPYFDILINTGNGIKEVQLTIIGYGMMPVHDNLSIYAFCIDTGAVKTFF